MDRSQAEIGAPGPDRGAGSPEAPPVAGGASGDPAQAGQEVKSGCTFFVQEKRGLRLFQVLTAPGAEKKGKKKLVELLHHADMQQATWSPCGRRLALVSQDQALVVFEHPTWTVSDVSKLWRGPAALASYCEKKAKSEGAAEGAGDEDEKTRDDASRPVLRDVQQFSLPLPERALAATSLAQPKYLQWSPLGTYLVAFYNVEKKRNGEEDSASQDHNVFVWDVAAREVVASFFVRRLVGSQWPLLKWRDDELFCCIASRNCIQVFSGHDLKKMLLRFPVPRVFNIEVAPCFSPELEQELLIGAFCPAAAPAGPALSNAQNANPQTAQFYVFHIPSVATAAATLASSCDVDWTLNPQARLQELLQTQRANLEKTEAAVKAALAQPAGVGAAEKKKGDSDSEEDASEGDLATSRSGVKPLAFYTVDETEVNEALAACADAEKYEAALVRCVVRQVVAAADSAELAWSPSGTGLIVMANTTVDAAGENYGGVGDCWYFCREPPVEDLARLRQVHGDMVAASRGKSEKFLAQLSAAAASLQALADAAQTLSSFVRKLSQKVAQDAKWSPTRDEFVLIEGKSPSDIYLLDKQCHVRFSFPPKYRNTINWGPFGQMVAIGGFGNLAGELSFWFRDSTVRGMSLITEWRAACTVQSIWAPSGDLFLTASTYPRMKVDNVFRVFDYEGEEIASVKFEELYKVAWKPESDLSPPPAPQRNEVALEQTRKGFYRPKNAQGILARVMRGELDESALPEELRRKPEESKKKRGAAAAGPAGSAAATAAEGALAAPKKAERDWGGLLDWRLQAKEENRVYPAAPGGASTEAEEGAPQAAESGSGQARARGRSKGAVGDQSPAPGAGGLAASGGAKGPEATASAEESRDSSQASESAGVGSERGEDRTACFSTLSSPRGDSAVAREALRGRALSDAAEPGLREDRAREVQGTFQKEKTLGLPENEQPQSAQAGREGGEAGSAKPPSEEASGADPRLGLGSQQLSAVQQLFLQGRLSGSSFFQSLQSASSSSLFRAPQIAAPGTPAQGSFASYPGVIGPSRGSVSTSSAAANGFANVSPRDAPTPGGPGAPAGGHGSFNKAPGPATAQPSGQYEELLRAFRNIVPAGALRVLQEGRAANPAGDARGSGAFGAIPGASLHGDQAAVANAQAALGAVLARLQQNKSGGAAGGPPGALPFLQGAQSGSSAPSAEAAAFYAELASRVQQRGGSASSFASSQLLKQQLLQQFARQQGQAAEEGGRFARGPGQGEEAAPEGRGAAQGARQPGPQGPPAGPGAAGAGARSHAQEVAQLLDHLRRGQTAEAVQFAHGSRAVWSLLQAAAQKQKLQKLQSQVNPKEAAQFQGPPSAKKTGNATTAGSASSAVRTPGAATPGLEKEVGGAQGGMSPAYANPSFQNAFLGSSFGASHGTETHAGAEAPSSHAQDEGFIADFMALQMQRKSTDSATAQVSGKQAFPFPTSRQAGSAALPARGPPELRSPTSLAAVTAAAVDALTQQYPQLTKEQAVLLLQKLRLGASGSSQSDSANASEHLGASASGSLSIDTRGDRERHGGAGPAPG
ncbi:GYF domain-containing protein, partial [Toxoplasma gondii RUB]